MQSRNGMFPYLASMREILTIERWDLLARVQPGVRSADLASSLEQFGLSPLKTSSSELSTVDAWPSTGGLGIDSFGYGHISRTIMGILYALMNGSIPQLSVQDAGLRDFLGKTVGLDEKEVREYIGNQTEEEEKRQEQLAFARLQRPSSPGEGLQPLSFTV